MDIIRKELVDNKRVNTLFSNVSTKFNNTRLKTNEKYLELLINELNYYFNDLNTSVINSNDLPDDRYGPSVSKHNKLLVNTISDIDKIHNKKTEVQDIITKSVNYMSTERLSVGNSVSRLQARFINQKIRMSSNDKHITTFTEYFTDDTFQDKKLSSNTTINKTASLLSLTPISESNDNSQFIDPKSIQVNVKFKEINSNLTNIYFGDIIGNNISNILAFGRSISNDIPVSTKANTYQATKDKTKAIDIQNQTLKYGYDEDQVESDISDNTFGEYEIIINDFTKLKEPILNSIKKVVNIDTDVLKTNNKYSFNGCNDDNVVNDFNNKDIEVKSEDIESIGIYFKLKENAVLPGFISYINLHFAPAYTTINIPEINYNKSYINDKNGKKWSSLIENNIDTEENKIKETKTLIINNSILSPTEFYIDLKKDNLQPVTIGKYKGMYWKTMQKGTDIVGDISLTGKIHNSSNHKYHHIYHDIKRTKDESSFNEMNREIAINIINDLNEVIKNGTN